MVEYVKITKEQFIELQRLAQIAKKYAEGSKKGATEMNRKQFEGKTQEEISEMMRERAKKAHEARRQNKIARQNDK